MQPYEVTASTVNEICPAIETWETGNRWLSKGKREEKIEAGEHRREEQDDKMAKPERKEGCREQGSPAHSPLVPQDGADHQQCQQQQQEHRDDDGGGA